MYYYTGCYVKLEMRPRYEKKIFEFSQREKSAVKYFMKSTNHSSPAQRSVVHFKLKSEIKNCSFYPSEISI
jgi:hypothetical protein